MGLQILPAGLVHHTQTLLCNFVQRNCLIQGGPPPEMSWIPSNPLLQVKAVTSVTVTLLLLRDQNKLITSKFHACQ